MTALRLGSLFTGTGGLDMAACEFFGARTVWTSDIDPGACKIITHRYPDVPNLGDITAIDWAAVEPVDILTGGFPCQDVSHAGKRAGLRPDTRTGLWTHMAYAINQLRPTYVVAENVRGLLSAAAHSNVEPCPWCLGGSEQREPDLRALGAVLGDLAELGYDARWVGLRAADFGAPHGRFRVFILAESRDTVKPSHIIDYSLPGCICYSMGRHTDCPHHGLAAYPNGPASSQRRLAAPGQAEGWRSRPDAGGRSGAPAADTDSERFQGRHDDQEAARHAPAPAGRSGRGVAAPDTERLGGAGRGVVRDMGGASEDRAGEAQERQRDRDATHDRGANYCRRRQHGTAKRRAVRHPAT